MLFELQETVRDEFPGFQIVRKEDSALMRAMAAVLRVLTLGRSRSFMDRYVTTVGQTVYVPSGWDSWSEVSRYVVLRHEVVHMRQARRMGAVAFAVAYLLLPLPAGLAYCRARLEMEAYGESIMALVERTGTSVVLSPGFQREMVDRLTGPDYLWCWPFKKAVAKWVRDAVDRAVAEYVRG